MKKILLLTVAAMATIMAKAQEVQKDSAWTLKGNVTVLGSQSSFSNWQAGGQNNFAVNGVVNYDANYKKGDITWDNKLIAMYGFNQLKGGFKQKTDDRLEINSVLGKQVAESNQEWYYSFFMNFKTQFDTGYDPKVVGYRNSHFMSPAYLQFGPGMLWKKNDNLKVNIAPATARFIFVNKQFTVDKESFGVAQGETMRFELGASLSAYYKVQLMENFSVENILNLYSNYLDKPQNVDIDYQLNAVLKVNKYISTNLLFQTIYDDNAYKGFQTRHTLGVGLTANF